MAEKRVTIDGQRIFHGTSIKGSVDTNASTVTTFDKVIPQGTKRVSHSIDMSKVTYENIATYTKVRTILDDMLDTPKTITIAEDVYPPGDEPFTIIRQYKNCLLDGMDYEIKPEEHTVENLKFKASGVSKKEIMIKDYRKD